MGMNVRVAIILGIEWEYSDEETFDMIKEHMESDGLEFDFEDMYDIEWESGIELGGNAMTGKSMALGIEIVNFGEEPIEMNIEKIRQESKVKKQDVKDWFETYLGMEVEPKLLIYGVYE